MNKFAFFFPAKIAFAESTVELKPIEFSGKTFYLGPLGKNVYFSCDKGRIVVSQNSPDCLQIFIKVGEYFCAMTNTPESNVMTWLEHKADVITELLPKWENQVNNPEIYEQEAAKTREKIKEEREERDRDEAERKLSRAKSAREAFLNTLNNFKNNTGVLIWENFEDACKEYGVKIPIKTIGYGRKNIISVSQTGLTSRGKCHNSPVLWAAIRELAIKLSN
jgi:hypothetical protein